LSASVRTRWFRSVTCGSAFTRARKEQAFGICEKKMLGMVLVGKCRGRPLHGHWVSLAYPARARLLRSFLVGTCRGRPLYVAGRAGSAYL
jgi:hypothetical protein